MNKKIICAWALSVVIFTTTPVSAWPSMRMPAVLQRFYTSIKTHISTIADTYVPTCIRKKAVKFTALAACAGGCLVFIAKIINPLRQKWVGRKQENDARQQAQEQRDLQLATLTQENENLQARIRELQAAAPTAAILAERDQARQDFAQLQQQQITLVRRNADLNALSTAQQVKLQTAAATHEQALQALQAEYAPQTVELASLRQATELDKREMAGLKETATTARLELEALQAAHAQLQTKMRESESRKKQSVDPKSMLLQKMQAELERIQTAHNEFSQRLSQFEEKKSDAQPLPHVGMEQCLHALQKTFAQDSADIVQFQQKLALLR